MFSAAFQSTQETYSLVCILTLAFRGADRPGSSLFRGVKQKQPG